MSVNRAPNSEDWMKHSCTDAKPDYEQVRKDEITRVVARTKVYQLTGNSLPADLPPFAYQVQIHRLRLPEWQENFTWCDEIEILDNQTNEEIAFSKRCLGYSPRFAVNPVGYPFHGGSRLGDERAYGFDDKVLFMYAIDRSGYDGERTWKFSPLNRYKN